MSHPRLYVEPEGEPRRLAGWRLSRPQFGWVEVRPLVDEVLESLAWKIDGQGIHVAIDVAESERAYLDREMFRRCLLNLTLNALEAMPKGGELAVTSYTGANGFELEIADSGPGLTAEVRRRALEPYYSTKPDGAGLGLSIVAHFAWAHGGNIDMRNCPEGGAAFTICIPQRALEAAA